MAVRILKLAIAIILIALVCGIGAIPILIGVILYILFLIACGVADSRRRARGSGGMIHA